MVSIFRMQRCHLFRICSFLKDWNQTSKIRLGVECMILKKLGFRGTSTFNLKPSRATFSDAYVSCPTPNIQLLVCKTLSLIAFFSNTRWYLSFLTFKLKHCLKICFKNKSSLKLQISGFLLNMFTSEVKFHDTTKVEVFVFVEKKITIFLIGQRRFVQKSI